MFGPGNHSESDVLVGYLEAQLTSIRAAAYGLTDFQARETPCRSTLSVGGLLNSFALADDETLPGALDAFDAARADCLADVRSFDPGGATTAPPAPWYGRFEPTDPVHRFELVHHIEEFARHAGHADLLREQLDGADAASLLMAVEGRPGNDFVQPWSPAGT